MAKKVFWPALGCAQHPKAGQNTQQLVEAQTCTVRLGWPPLLTLTLAWLGTTDWEFEDCELR